MAQGWHMSPYPHWPGEHEAIKGIQQNPSTSPEIHHLPPCILLCCPYTSSLQLSHVPRAVHPMVLGQGPIPAHLAAPSEHMKQAA